MPKIIAFAGVPGAGKDTAGEFLRQYVPNVKIAKFAHPLQDIVALIEGNYDVEKLAHRTLFDNHTWKNSRVVNIRPIFTDILTRQTLFTHIVKVLIGENVFEDEYPLSKCFLTLYKAEGAAEVVSGIWLYEQIDKWFDEVFTEEVYSPREIMRLFGTELCREHISPDIWLSILGQTLSWSRDTDTVVITDLRFSNEAALVEDWGGSLIYIDNAIAFAKADAKNLLHHASEQDQDKLRSRARFIISNPMEAKSVFGEIVLRTYNTIFMGDE